MSPIPGGGARSEHYRVVRRRSLGGRHDRVPTRRPRYRLPDNLVSRVDGRGAPAVIDQAINVTTLSVGSTPRVAVGRSRISPDDGGELVVSVPQNNIRVIAVREDLKLYTHPGIRRRLEQWTWNRGRPAFVNTAQTRRGNRGA